jgi:hypothetical protein
MTHDTWTQQKARFIDRFGQNNFSKEFSLLVSIECNSMPDQAFVDLANAMIGNRKPSNPPLLQDFRDARLAYERRKFESDVAGAARAMHQPMLTDGLSKYLTKTYGAECKTLWQAVEMQRELNKLREVGE